MTDFDITKRATKAAGRLAGLSMGGWESHTVAEAASLLCDMAVAICRVRAECKHRYAAMDSSILADHILAILDGKEQTNENTN